MFNQIAKVSKLGRKSALVLAGLLAAAGSSALLPDRLLTVKTSSPQNPVITKVIRDAKRHRAKGRLKKAALLLEKHARPEYPSVLLNYAKFLARGWGIPRDLVKAREKLLLAVQHDFPKWGEAAFELARVYRQSIGPDCERIAFEWFVESARAGHMQAHAELGRHYSRGIGVPVDMQQALDHYRIAARAGYANSLVAFVRKVTRSAEPIFSKVELRRIVDEAIPALELEAISGRGSSAKVLGRLYRDGVLVDADEAVAEMWFERGARLGDSGSMVELALNLLKKPDHEELAQRAIALLHKAASLRNSGAFTELGRLHLKSAYGLARSDAPIWFERGVSAGHAGAMMELAKLQLKKSPGKKQLAGITKLLRRGAAKGHLGCQRMLSELIGGGPMATADVPAKSKRPSVSKKEIKSAVNSRLDAVSQLKQLRQLAEQRRTRELASDGDDPMTGATTITPFKRGS
ncbi:MAG: tetratricopeptide repeat protein [Rhizobiaceae bacterium]